MGNEVPSWADGGRTPNICSLVALEVDQVYTFNPPLDVAIVTINSKHQLGGRKSRHPKFLEKDMLANGVSRGRLIYKSEFDASGKATGTFSCEAKFHNDTTGMMETVHYTATCKFSQRAVEGIRVLVRRQVQDLKELEQ